jgi:hypothetical protein
MTTDERFAALEARLDASESQNLAYAEAFATVERGIRNFKPIPLNHPANAALRAIVESVDAVTEPFVRPRHHTWPGPRETRPSELGETREGAA